MVDIVDFYGEHGRYGCFSTFYGIHDNKFKLVIDGISYKTTEHYYQCMKFNDGTPIGKEYVDIVTESDTPYKSKVLGHLGFRIYKNINTWRISNNNRRLIKDIMNSYRSKGLKIKDDFEENKISIMYKCVYEKFNQNEHLRDILLSTGDQYLIEDTKNDNFWGIGDGNGQNNLGKILMKVRKELKS